MAAIKKSVKAEFEMQRLAENRLVDYEPMPYIDVIMTNNY